MGGLSLDGAVLDCVVCRGIWGLGSAGFGGGGGHWFAGHLILALVFLRGFYFAGGLGARLSSWGFWDFPDIY